MSVSRVLIPILSGLEQNEKPLVKQVLKGVKQIQHQELNSQSHSTTQTSFSFQPPSQNTIIDRQFILEMDVSVQASGNVVFDDLNALETDGNYDVASEGRQKKATQTFKFKNTKVLRNGVNMFPALTPVVGAGTDVPSLVASINTNLTTILNSNRNPSSNDVNLARGNLVTTGNNFAPKQFPLNSCLDSIDITINGTHFSVPVNQYLDAVMRYSSPEYREKHLSMCPHHPDIYAKYQSTCGEQASPLGIMGETGRKGETPRGHFLDDAYMTKKADKTRVTFKLQEPLFISPLMASLGHGITNINNIDIVLRWNSNLLNKMFSVLNTANAGSVGGSFLAADGTTATSLVETGLTVDFNNVSGGSVDAKLLVNYYQAQDDVKIPNEIILPYKQPQVHSKVVDLSYSQTSNNAQTVGDNIRLNQIPDACYIYAKPKRGGNIDKASIGSAFPRIANVSIQWKNQSNLLSGFNEDQLIAMAMDNGYDLQPDEIKRNDAEGNGGGLVLKLIFGKDIPLDDNESAGTRGDYNWRCDVTFRNNSQGGEYEFYQVFIMNGHAIISPNECRVATGVLDLKDNIDSQEMGHTHGNDNGLIGGSFVGGGIKDIMGHLRTVAKVGSSAHKVMKDCGPAVAQAVQQYKSRA
tara:strand:+ start:577 stop:2487 length:1911 start_codon:yes stop_codon:yes gene_type:complete